MDDYLYKRAAFKSWPIFNKKVAGDRDSSRTIFLQPLWMASIVAALTLGTSLEAKDIHESGETLYESQAKIETVGPNLYAVTPIRQAASNCGVFCHYSEISSFA